MADHQPLDAFIESLSLEGRHTHTAGRLSNTDASMKCDAMCDGAVTLQAQVKEVHAEPGSHRPACWEAMDGIIRQGVVTWLTKTREADGTERFWCFIAGDGMHAWVREDRLRSMAAYEAQQARRGPHS